MKKDINILSTENWINQWRELLRNGNIEEIEELLNNESDSFKLATYLNNIHINVLGMRIEDEIIKTNWKIQEIQNTKRSESGHYDKAKDRQIHSEKRLNQSAAEFEKEAGEILLPHGIDINELAKEFLKLRKEYNDMKDFKKKFIPIYIILRKLWYTHTELVA